MGSAKHGPANGPVASFCRVPSFVTTSSELDENVVVGPHEETEISRLRGWKWAVTIPTCANGGACDVLLNVQALGMTKRPRPHAEAGGRST